jgi:hypothetical protein
MCQSAILHQLTVLQTLMLFGRENSLVEFPGWFDAVVEVWLKILET